MHTVYLRHYAPPPFDTREILRYAGVRSDVSDLDPLLHECLEEATDKLTYRVCYCELPLTFQENFLNLGFLTTCSHSLQNHLEGCESILLFAATVGTEIDRLMARYAPISPTKALLLQAIGAERIEALCDVFCSEIEQEKEREGMRCTRRFSPGYGDFPLEAQRKIFSVLDCPRKIGLSLTESLLMSPTKSVTAIVGISPKE